MKERRWTIIHISSIMALVAPMPAAEPTARQGSADRHGAFNAMELGSFGITVNCLAPGPFLTDLPGKLLSDAEKQRFGQMTALGRWGGYPKRIGWPACFWHPRPAVYITGETIVVDLGDMCALRLPVQSGAGSVSDGLSAQPLFTTSGVSSLQISE